MDEVEISAAFHLEAYTDETSAEVFQRACQVLRDAGIRVKAGYAPSFDSDPEAVRSIDRILY